MSRLFLVYSSKDITIPANLITMEESCLVEPCLPLRIKGIFQYGLIMCMARLPTRKKKKMSHHLSLSNRPQQLI